MTLLKHQSSVRCLDLSAKYGGRGESRGGGEGGEEGGEEGGGEVERGMERGGEGERGTIVVHFSTHSMFEIHVTLSVR